MHQKFGPLVEWFNKGFLIPAPGFDSQRVHQYTVGSKMVKSSIVIKKLVEDGVIPEFGEFDITEILVDSYQKAYKSLYEKSINY
jgi:hypothetical protein